MRFSVFLLAAAALFAQSRRSDLSLGGVVVNSQTGEPIKNALVTLVRIPAPRTGVRDPVDFEMKTKTAFTGVGGEFLFAGLAEGEYRLNSEKPGFTVDAPQPWEGRSVLIELTSSVNSLRLSLAPLGVIEGQVLDQYGEPVRGLNVIAATTTVQDGLRTTHSDRSVTTNDQGRYRLWNLMPGKYYVKAAGYSGGTYTYVGNGASVADAWEGFVPVYAGGARDLDSANPVVIRAGDQARADIDIIREPAVRIRGMLGGFIPHETVKFELLRGNEEVSASRTTLNGATGRFEILNVTRGTYVLRVTQAQKSRAQIVVNVGDGDVNNVALTLAPAITVKVIVHTPDSSREAARPDRFQESGRSGFCRVTLHPSDRNALPLSTARRPRLEEIVIENVLPGEYRVDVQCRGGYPTAVMAGSVDLLAHPALSVVPSATMAPIEITLKPGGGTLSGKLLLPATPQQPGILLVPAFAASPGPILKPLSQDPDSPGISQFTFGSLTPGDYVAYAFSRHDEVEFRSPAFLQSLSGGTPVRIEESVTKEITLSSVIK